MKIDVVEQRDWTDQYIKIARPSLAEQATNSVIGV
jgi:hypothetical protein